MGPLSQRPVRLRTICPAKEETGIPDYSLDSLKIFKHSAACGVLTCDVSWLLYARDPLCKFVTNARMLFGLIGTGDLLCDTSSNSLSSSTGTKTASAPEVALHPMLRLTERSLTAACARLWDRMFGLRFSFSRRFGAGRDANSVRGKVTRVVDQGDFMSFGVRGDFDDDHLTPSFRETS